MKFKKDYMKAELERSPLILQLIAFEFEQICRKFKIEPTITRVSDAIKGSSGVHAAGRAFDIRDEFPCRVFVFEHKHRLMLVEYFNRKYERRDKKPTVLWHSFKKGPFHFHVQVAAELSAYKFITRPYESEGPCYDS
jgi:hypothetical protein